MRSESEWRARWDAVWVEGLRTGKWQLVDDALRFGREMADERAEEIAQLCDRVRLDAESRHGTTSIAAIHGLEIAAGLARGTIKGSEPRTREERLEAALRRIAEPGRNDWVSPINIARAALEEHG